LIVNNKKFNNLKIIWKQIGTCSQEHNQIMSVSELISITVSSFSLSVCLIRLASDVSVSIVNFT
ncbi:hypothetical protein L9F63_000739, partial [Diploptera punctata]